MQVLVPCVMTLLPRFVAASAASSGDDSAAAATTDDDETAKGMARLFAEVREHEHPEYTAFTSVALCEDSRW
jgi:hypothetical protein